MAKSVKWQNKAKTENHQYKSVMGETDYDIPTFGYKSSFIVILSIILSLFIVPFGCDALGVDYRLPTVIIGGLVSGFSAVYAQFFIQSKKGICKSFWVVGSLLSVFSAGIIAALVYTGVMKSKTFDDIFTIHLYDFNFDIELSSIYVFLKFPNISGLKRV